MVDKVGDEFTGYVTGVTAFGLFIELVETFLSRGSSTSRAWPMDYYRFLRAPA